jgi:hypothetical protein
MDHIAMNVREAPIDAIMAESKLFVVDSQQVKMLSN